MKYFKFRRGTVIHFEKKSDKHKTWTVCGKVRISHTLFETDEKTVEDNIDMICKLCMLGMTRKVFELYQEDMLQERILNDPEIMKAFMDSAMKNIETLEKQKLNGKK